MTIYEGKFYGIMKQEAPKVLTDGGVMPLAFVRFDGVYDDISLPLFYLR